MSKYWIHRLISWGIMLGTALFLGAQLGTGWQYWVACVFVVSYGLFCELTGEARGETK